jgi:transposase
VVELCFQLTGTVRISVRGRMIGPWRRISSGAICMHSMTSHSRTCDSKYTPNMHEHLWTSFRTSEMTSHSPNIFAILCTSPKLTRCQSQHPMALQTSYPYHACSLVPWQTCSTHSHVGIVAPWDTSRCLARISDIAIKDSPILAHCFTSSPVLCLLLIFLIHFWSRYVFW